MSTEALILQWQRLWHDLFDADAYVAEQRPAALPPISEDTRLHFGLWDAAPETRRAALTQLPEGVAIARRVEEGMHDVAAELPQAAAHAMLRMALGAQHAFGMGDAHPPITVANRFPEDLMGCDAVTLDLDDALWDMAEAKSPAHLAALEFLTEIFYRHANDYHIAHWLMWPLVAPPNAPDVYAPFARLTYGGWAAGRTGAGEVILVAKEPAEPPFCDPSVT